MQEPLFKNRRTYFVLFLFFALLAFVVFRDSFGKVTKTTGLLQSPAQVEEVSESENNDYKLEENETHKAFIGEGLRMTVPKLWTIGVILYRPSEPNIILAMSNSVDLGASTQIPSGVVRGKVQLSTQQYATEFSEASKSEIENPKSKFWEARKKAFEGGENVKVTVTTAKFGDREYTKEEMRVVDSSKNVDATSWIFYRLVGEGKIVAVSWSWENQLSSDLQKNVVEIMETLSI